LARASRRLKLIFKHMSSLSGEIKPGALVRPVAVYPSYLHGVIRLTPTRDPDNEEWPEWHFDEVGIVLPPIPGQVGILVMVPRGVGWCLRDELKEVL